MKIDSLKLITGKFRGGVSSNKFGAGFAFGAYICLSVAIFRQFGDARSCEPWPIVATSGVFPNALGEISSALLAPRMFSGRLRCRLRLQQLRVWMDLLRPTARGSVLTLLRRPPFTDSLA